jgi:ATP-dependent Clp protease protease subunit
LCWNCSFYGVFRISWGTKGSRVALPHSRIMIHQPEGGSHQATVVLSESEEVLRIRDEVAQFMLIVRANSSTYCTRYEPRSVFISAKQRLC